MKTFLYKYIKFLSALFLRFYFSKIEINGKKHIPQKGTPFIIAPNHQNAFLDAVIIGALADRPVYYLARSDAFKKPWDYFLDAFNMMPIYRLRDGYSQLNKNDQIFKTCQKILTRGDCLLMFPEGNQTLEYYLRPLTKGIARIAVKTQAQYEKDVFVLPVGINFFNHKASGRKLILNYGESFSVKEFIPSYNENKNKAYLKFIRKLSSQIKSNLVIESDGANYKKMKTVFTRKNERLDYKSLKALALKAQTFPKDTSSIFIRFLTSLLLVPNFLPFLLLHYILSNVLNDGRFDGSIKLGVGVVVLPIWWLICAVLAFALGGLKWALILMLLQLGTLICRSYLTRFVH